MSVEALQKLSGCRVSYFDLYLDFRFLCDCYLYVSGVRTSSMHAVYRGFSASSEWLITWQEVGMKHVGEGHVRGARVCLNSHFSRVLRPPLRVSCDWCCFFIFASVLTFVGARGFALEVRRVGTAAFFRSSRSAFRGT